MAKMWSSNKEFDFGIAWDHASKLVVLCITAIKGKNARNRN